MDRRGPDPQAGRVRREPADLVGRRHQGLARLVRPVRVSSGHQSRQRTIVTANNRIVGPPALAMLGDGGYDPGARARQIRDDLMALDKADGSATCCASNSTIGRCSWTAGAPCCPGVLTATWPRARRRGRSSASSSSRLDGARLGGFGRLSAGAAVQDQGHRLVMAPFVARVRHSIPSIPRRPAPAKAWLGPGVAAASAPARPAIRRPGTRCCWRPSTSRLPRSPRMSHAGGADLG